MHRGAEYRVMSRLEEKLQQVAKKGGSPALAVVVGFEQCLIAIADTTELQGKD